MYNIHVVKRFRAHCGFYAIENKLLLLLLLFEHVESGGGTNIGLMRDTWTDSLRVQCLLNDVTQVSSNHV